MFSVFVPLQFRLLCAHNRDDRVRITVSPSLWQLDHCSHEVHVIAGVVGKVTVVVGKVSVVVGKVTVVLGKFTVVVGKVTVVVGKVTVVAGKFTVGVGAEI